MRIGFPCPPHNAISNPWDGPPSVAGQTIHGAVDFPAPVGTPLLAPLSGIVTYSGFADGNTGQMIEVSAGGLSVRMLHLSFRAVSIGRAVTKGAEIGRTGNTGLSTGPHVHMATWCDSLALALTIQPDPVQVYGRWAVDPELLLGQEDDDMTADECKAIVDAALKPVADDLARVKKDLADVNQWLFAPNYYADDTDYGNNASAIHRRVK